MRPARPQHRASAPARAPAVSHHSRPCLFHGIASLRGPLPEGGEGPRPRGRHYTNPPSRNNHSSGPSPVPSTAYTLSQTRPLAGLSRRRAASREERHREAHPHELGDGAAGDRGRLSCTISSKTGRRPAPAGPARLARRRAQPGEAGYPHLRWGNPSGATADAGNRDNYLMEKKYYALSYNNTKGTPNWVSWRLVKEDLGDASREGLIFQPDDELPAGFKKIVHEDYIGSRLRPRTHVSGRRPQPRHGLPQGDLRDDQRRPPVAANNATAWEQFESTAAPWPSKARSCTSWPAPTGRAARARRAAPPPSPTARSWSRPRRGRSCLS